MSTDNEASLSGLGRNDRNAVGRILAPSRSGYALRLGEPMGTPRITTSPRGRSDYYS